MIEILSSPGPVVALRLSGPVDGKDVETAYRALDDALGAHDKVSLYAEVDKSADFSFEALYEDLRHGFGKLGQTKRFYRAALVTDKKWLAALARAEGVMFSRIEVRVFPFAEREEALKWASAEFVPPEEPPKTPSLRMIETSDPKVLAYELDGRLTVADLRILIDAVTPEFKKQEKIRLLGRVKRYAGFDLGVLLEDGLFALKANGLRKVERYALVGAPSWLQNLTELIDPFFSVELKNFEADRETEAWEWVGARPAAD
ncbi:MAG: STAS/SEC14 domain-containing protein [Acidobacteria bacterium]|nr:STAS/SEC14 domain-containing protein [Acidobacteriota bacterium]